MRADSPLSEALYEDARYIQGDHCREILDIEVEQEQRSVRPFIVQDGAETAAGGSAGISIGSRWEAIGPFPSGTREHSLMSSPLAAFPSTASDQNFAHLPLDSTETWPSQLASGGQVGWKVFETAQDGWVEVTYPEINWAQLRSDHGWAALQYQAVLRTSLTVGLRHAAVAEQLRPGLLQLIRGTEFALVPKRESPTPYAEGRLQTAPGTDVIWYNGDVYSYALEDPVREDSSVFAHRVDLTPGEYVLIVRANYEIRLFGDPGDQAPVFRFKFISAIDQSTEDAHHVQFELVPVLHEVPDMVDGWFIGTHIAVGLRMITPLHNSSEWSLESVKVSGQVLSLRGYDNFRQPSSVAASIPLAIEQLRTARGRPNVLKIALIMRSSTGMTVDVPVTLPIVHLDSPRCTHFRYTFVAAEDDGLLQHTPALVSHAVAIPPLCHSIEPHATILALHGAGVDATLQVWIESIPRRRHGWAILPTGRTSWGEDWHGGSMDDAWAARFALKKILQTSDEMPWHANNLEYGTILLGHSNGGQGVWHLASHWPDRVVGVVAAAGYSKIQDYVPYLQWTSNHYADPALSGVLQCALSPYNNDLYLSNLAGIPVLAVHGASDSNVPPRHSRLQVGILQALQGSHQFATLLEVSDEDHWWPKVLNSRAVLDFISQCPTSKKSPAYDDATSLVTFGPAESGSRDGFTILQQVTAGSSSYLKVHPRPLADCSAIAFAVITRNVSIFSYSGHRAFEAISVDGCEITVGRHTSTTHTFQLQDELWKCLPTDNGFESPIAPHSSLSLQPLQSGPMIRFLAGRRAMSIVINLANPHHRSIAHRIQQALFVYHRISSRIIDFNLAHDLVRNNNIGPGNVVSIGECLSVTGLKGPSRPKPIEACGWISLYPHPVAVGSLAMVIGGTDVNHLELALRLFPLRTGVPIPDWVVISREASWKGAGGFLGAGFWATPAALKPGVTWGVIPPLWPS